MERLRQAFVATLFLLAFPPIVYAEIVDVNTADAETISAELKGIGLSKAAAIVEYREAHGPFKSLDDLMQVKGIGPRTIEINRENIRFDSKDAKPRK